MALKSLRLFALSLLSLLVDLLDTFTHIIQGCVIGTRSMLCFVLFGCIADGRLTARSRQVSTPRDSGLNCCSRSKIWQAPRQRYYRYACQNSERYDHYNTLAASWLREIWRWDVLPLSEERPRRILTKTERQQNKKHEPCE